VSPLAAFHLRAPTPADELVAAYLAAFRARPDHGATVTATLIGPLPAHLPGVEKTLYATDGTGGPAFVVVVRAEVVGESPQVFVYASDANGTIEDWMDPPGSMFGGVSDAEALAAAGYTLAVTP
jgi:hypothetical protein